ncbi:MAG: hypothetical protein WA633_00575 [Stellaceae bacterium]
MPVSFQWRPFATLGLGSRSKVRAADTCLAAASSAFPGLISASFGSGVVAARNSGQALGEWIYFKHDRPEEVDLYRRLFPRLKACAPTCGREWRMTDLIKALRERREELRNKLQEDPAFQEYELVCRLLERREASVPISPSLRPKTPQRKPASQRKPAPQQQPVDRPAPFTRTDKGMNAVIEASAEFLRRKGARADSVEIQKELVRRGILEDGPRDRSRITSYLGRAKAMFDNVRGEGYGLREWRPPSG